MFFFSRGKLYYYELSRTLIIPVFVLEDDDSSSDLRNAMNNFATSLIYDANFHDFWKN